MPGVVTASLSPVPTLTLGDTGFRCSGRGLLACPCFYIFSKLFGSPDSSPRKLKGVWAEEGEIGRLHGFSLEAGTRFPLLLCICYRSPWGRLSPAFHGQICSTLLIAGLLVLLEP